MQIRRLAQHQDLLPAGRSTRIRAVWMVELEAGEETRPHEHPELDEVYCMVEGEGEIVVRDEPRPVRAGEVLHVPALTRHWLRNPFPRTLRCVTLESPTHAEQQGRTIQVHKVSEMPPEEPSALEPTAEDAPLTVRQQPGATSELEALAEGLTALEQMILDMPESMDRVAAIQKIVVLFDMAGQLSERIEQIYGLDNERGVQALSRIERRVMDAVVEITRRYSVGDNDLDLGSFGGRLGRRS